jgi:GWxTD domain-containing protein
MSYLASWIHSGLAQALGWTLAHFVWEGAVLALMLALGLRLFRTAPARRYALAGAVLAAMPLAFAATLAVMWLRQPASLAAPLPAMPAPALSPAVFLPAPAAGFTLSALLDRLPWLVPFWIAGVLFFSARGVAGWMAVGRLRRRGVCAPPPEWQRRLDELAARLRVTRPVALLESCLTDSPVLIGYLRPAILLPLGCLTGLSAGQLECILLHELEHIRRHDYIVNLLQSAVEGLLFYHPAVWWVSRVVRAERENCCDDAVVEAVGDARAYAATLAVLEQKRSLAPQAALAATGGNLMERIRRLTVEPRRAQTSAAPAVSAVLLLVLFAAALAAVPGKPRTAHAAVAAAGVVLDAAPPQSAAQDARQASIPTPYQKWLSEDVAYIIRDDERAAFLKLLTDADREDFIEQFWLRRDPTPGTVRNEFKEEHYRRIAYTNEHFAESRIPGWKTDRGRIYITYGPPDIVEISGPRIVVWTYRLIDGVGENVKLQFVDSQNNGEFHLTLDPTRPHAVPPQADQAAKVFVSHQGPAVSVMVPGRRGSTPKPGTIGVGDVLSVEFLAPETAPNQIPLADQQKLLEEAWANAGLAAAELGDHAATLQAVRDAIWEFGSAVPLAQLQADEKLLQAQLAAADKQLDSTTKQAGELAQANSRGASSAMENQLHSLQEQQKQAALYRELLRVTLRDIQNFENQARHSVGANTGAADPRYKATAQVRPDGMISIHLAGEIAAAGLTPAQLQAAVDGALSKFQIRADSQVRIEETADQTKQLVTVAVPLEPAEDQFHVFGEVTTQSRRVVQSFEAAVSRQPAVAKFLPLAAGTYRLVVVSKNMTTGLVRNSELEFTVD